MIDLSWTAEQQSIKNATRDFLQAKYPLSTVEGIDRSCDVVDGLFAAGTSLGCMGLALPEQWGGVGGRLMDLAALYEEFGRACLPLAHLSSSVLCGLTLLSAARDDHKREFLAEIASGSKRWCLALTELDYGWVPVHVRLRATRQGNGFTLEGVKAFVPCAEGADRLLVVGRTGEVEQAITLFVVTPDAPGVAIERMPSWAGDRLAAITFHNTPVSSEMVIGEIDQGWPPLASALDKATALTCAYIVGGLERVSEMAIDYSRTRKQFGTYIGTFQRVQDRVISIVNALDAARWSAYEAIWRLEAENPASAMSISMAKALASTGYVTAVEEAHHIYAGYSSDKAVGLWQYARRARFLYSFLGDPALHKERIARCANL